MTRELPRPTREELLALYRAGPEAVIGLVEALLARSAALEQAHAAQEMANADLVARVKYLEDRLALDSHNSSRPPSSDWGKPAPRSLRPAPGTSGRRPGGQPGHPGTTLRLVDTPDRLALHRPTQCAGCGAGLTGVAGGPARVGDERRQVAELPPLALAVTEHRVVHLTCGRCGVETAGTFPVGVTEPVQYGARLKAVGVYLHDYQLLPYARATELLDDLFGAGGVTPCERTLQAAEAACFDGLAPTEAAITAALQRAGVAHFDETSTRVAGQREWLHVASTATLTHYGVHPKRGTAATDALGILPAFTGTATHDAWAPYFTYDSCTHALCAAHLLRDLIYLHEQHQQTWADELATLLVTAKDLVATARAAGQGHLDAATRATLEAHYDHLLDQGRAANPALAPPPAAAGPKRRGRKKQTKAQNLLARLTTRRQAVWAFADDFAVPFDNNQAERDLRMLKVQQKISGGFRSAAGAAAFARIRGYLSTLRKQGLPVLRALEGVFAGSPLVPNLVS